MWDPPRPGVKPVSPTWAGGFLTPRPPGTPRQCTAGVLLKIAWGLKQDTAGDTGRFSLQDLGWLHPQTCHLWPRAALFLCVLWREQCLEASWPLICLFLPRYVRPGAEVRRLHRGRLTGVLAARNGLHPPSGWAPRRLLGGDWPHHQPAAHGDVCGPREQVVLLPCFLSLPLGSLPLSGVLRRACLTEGPLPDSDCPQRAPGSQS